MTKEKSSQEIIKLAQEGIKRKKSLLNARAKTDAHVWETEYDIYFEAQDLLCSHGYELKHDPKIQEAFPKIVPDNSVLKRELAGNLARLFADDVNDRVTAAKNILDETCAELGCKRYLWLRHPKTVTILLKALNDRENCVVDIVIQVLGMIYERTLKDLRIVDALVPLLSTVTNKSVISALVRATMFIERDDKWMPLLRIIQSNPSQAVVRDFEHHVRKAPASFRSKLLPHLVECFFRPRINEQTKLSVMEAISECVIEDTIDDFKQMVDLSQESEFQELFLSTIAENEHFYLAERFPT